MNLSKEAAGQCSKYDNPSFSPPLLSILKNSDGASNIASSSARSNVSSDEAYTKRSEAGPNTTAMIYRIVDWAGFKRVLAKRVEEQGVIGHEELKELIHKYYLDELNKSKSSSNFEELSFPDEDTSSTDISEDEESEEDLIDEGMETESSDKA